MNMDIVELWGELHSSFQRKKFTILIFCQLSLRPCSLASFTMMGIVVSAKVSFIFTDDKTEGLTHLDKNSQPVSLLLG